MKNIALQNLSAQGHNVVVSDLYGQGFSAIAQKWDFVTTSGSHFNYMLDQKHSALLQNAFSPDILGEIEKVKAADAVVFIAPLWWSSVPAILKGWFDRILAMGVAWDTAKIYENGLFRGKQALLAVAAGHPADYYKPKGRHLADMNQTLHPITHGTLAFCGFNVHEPFVAMNVLGASREELDKAMKDWQFKVDNFASSPQWLWFYG